MRKYMPYFREMVLLAKQILSHEDVETERRTFAFDCEIVVPLYAVAWRCPHSETRKEAIALLLGKPRKECLWDGVLAGRIAEWVCALEEEEGLDGEGYVAVERRMKGLTMEFDVLTRRASVSGLMPKRGKRGL
jgi:hypothetical protein